MGQWDVGATGCRCRCRWCFSHHHCCPASDRYTNPAVVGASAEAVAATVSARHSELQWDTVPAAAEQLTTGGLLFVVVACPPGVQTYPSLLSWQPPSRQHTLPFVWLLIAFFFAVHRCRTSIAPPQQLLLLIGHCFISSYCCRWYSHRHLICFRSRCHYHH